MSNKSGIIKFISFLKKTMNYIIQEFKRIFKSSQESNKSHIEIINSIVYGIEIDLELHKSVSIEEREDNVNIYDIYLLGHKYCLVYSGGIFLHNTPLSNRESSELKFFCDYKLYKIETTPIEPTFKIIASFPICYTYFPVSDGFSYSNFEMVTNLGERIIYTDNSQERNSGGIFRDRIKIHEPIINRILQDLKTTSETLKESNG